MTCLLKEARGAPRWQYFALGYIIYVKVAYSGIFLGLLYYLGVRGSRIYRASPLPHLLSLSIHSPLCPRIPLSRWDRWILGWNFPEPPAQAVYKTFPAPTA